MSPPFFTPECDLLGAVEALGLWQKFPLRAKRLMDVQQAAQSLSAHAAAVGRSSQLGGAAPLPSQLMLWPSGTIFPICRTPFPPYVRN